MREKSHSQQQQQQHCYLCEKTQAHIHKPLAGFSLLVYVRKRTSITFIRTLTLSLFLYGLIVSAWQQLLRFSSVHKAKARKTEKPLQSERTKAEFILFPTRSERVSHRWLTLLEQIAAAFTASHTVNFTHGGKNTAKHTGSHQRNNLCVFMCLFCDVSGGFELSSWELFSKSSKNNMFMLKLEMLK